jgi:hypothetical protein
MSEVLCQLFQFAERGARVLAGASLKAMFDMVVNQLLLRLFDRCLDRVKLLGKLDARSTALDHSNDGAEVPFGSLEAEHDFRVSAVHPDELSNPPG